MPSRRAGATKRSGAALCTSSLGQGLRAFFIEAWRFVFLAPLFQSANSRLPKIPIGKARTVILDHLAAHLPLVPMTSTITWRSLCQPLCRPTPRPTQASMGTFHPSADKPAPPPSAPKRPCTSPHRLGDLSVWVWGLGFAGAALRPKPQKIPKKGGHPAKEPD